jgi:hypothetical protein
LGKQPKGEDRSNVDQKRRRYGSAARIDLGLKKTRLSVLHLGLCSISRAFESPASSGLSLPGMTAQSMLAKISALLQTLTAAALR